MLQWSSFDMIEYWLLHDIRRLGAGCSKTYDDWVLIASQHTKIGCWLLHNIRRLGVGCSTTYEDWVLVAPWHTTIECWLLHDIRRLSVGCSTTYEGLFNVAMNNIEMIEECDYHCKAPTPPPHCNSTERWTYFILKSLTSMECGTRQMCYQLWSRVRFP